MLDKFLEGQRAALLEERATYTHQAESLQAEADLLAAEREPGDVQFDEESGEGDTLAVERERDLALSAQARAAVDEIDAALAKIADGTLRRVRAVRQDDPEGAPAGHPVRGAVRPVQEHGARPAVNDRAGRRRPGSLRWSSSVAALVVVADQLTKWWAVRTLDDRDIDLFWTLRLHLVRNSGAAFSLAGGRGGLVAHPRHRRRHRA